MLNRRQTLQALAALWPGAALADQQRTRATFRHGVASGDPTRDSVVLWTRLSGVAAKAEVHWQIARDPAFRMPFGTGLAHTGPERDFTVKVVATGLAAGEPFYYRFRHGDIWSPTGRSRTLPDGSVTKLRLAVASCSNYSFGHFNAYDAMARDTAIHFVLHTGDYLYEYGSDEWGSEPGRRLQRSHRPAHEIVSLADYRERHAQYKEDVGAQAMHATHPCILIWDDHESANNPWTGGAQNHQPETEGSWAARRAAALQAWYEWMPVRDPAPGARPEEYWRNLQFGDLATLVCLETRHTARAQQVEYGEHASAITDTASRDRFLRDILGAADRTMLSPAMETALEEALRASITGGQPWRLIGNAIPMARMPVPDLSRLTFMDSRPGKDDIAQLLWKSRWQLPWYTDTWDGYPWARERFYQTCAGCGVRDLVVLTGDSHSFWLNRLADATGHPMGVELGTTGITSPGDFLDLGFTREEAAALDQAMIDGLPEVMWTDNLHNGYLQVDLTARAIDVACVAVSTVESLRYQTRILQAARITRRNGQLHMSLA